MAEKMLRAKSYADFSKACWQSIGEALAPENSVKLNLNLNSDEILSWLVSRLGTTLVGAQLVDNKPILGLHNFRDSVGSGSKLFAAISDGANTDIYDVVAGTKSLQDDTKDLKTRFLTYLDSCVRLNGTDAAKAWNGTAWVTTGGAFDLANFPSGAGAAIEFKDRVYAYLFASDPDKVQKSGIANAATRQISWTVDNGFIVFEQEDGGGGLTAGAKVPGYLLFWKKRTMKRFDGSSAYPEDMVNQGCPSQEAVVVAAQTAWWVNENGAWASQGGAPKKISSYTVDSIIKSCTYADLLKMGAGTDEEHVWWSFPTVTMLGETYTNIVIKYNILQNTWDVRKYPTQHRVYAKYVDSDGEVFTVAGDDDGNVLKMDTGETDNGVPISWAMETQDWTFGYRLFEKSITQIGFVTEGMSKAQVVWRNTHKTDSWKPVGVIDREVIMFDRKDFRGTFYNFKIFDTADSGRSIIKAIEIPEGTKVYDNTQS